MVFNEEMDKATAFKIATGAASMGITGISKEALISAVDSFAGVATYLSKATKEKVNLFI